MEAKTNGRVQRSASEWQQILNRFAESGRSRAAFCRAEGISPATFDVWQRKLGAKQAARKAAREFVEVTPVSSPGLGGWLVEIELPGDVARRALWRAHENRGAAGIARTAE